MTYAGFWECRMHGAICERMAVITSSSVRQKLATRTGVMATSIRDKMRPFDLLANTISSHMEEYCDRG